MISKLAPQLIPHNGYKTEFMIFRVFFLQSTSSKEKSDMQKLLRVLLAERKQNIFEIFKKSIMATQKMQNYMVGDSINGFLIIC